MDLTDLRQPISHGSLFSGIGGFDLAARWVGWKNLFQVEKDDWCKKVLAKNFPEVKRFSDIKDFTGYEYTDRVDVISGGFPCQPFSVAGKRKGKDDDRYLWEEMLRVVTAIRPTYVVGENVTGIIGLALDTVLFDLETQGYTTEAFIIPACGKNAWHRRDRVWIIAYSNHGRILRTPGKNERTSKSERIQEWNKVEQSKLPDKLWSASVFPDTATSGFQNRGNEEVVKSEQEQKFKRCNSIFADTDNAGLKKQRNRITEATELYAPKCSSWWQTEPKLGRVVDGLPGRVDRLKGLGNAIVPQVAYEIFSAINLTNP